MHLCVLESGFHWDWIGATANLLAVVGLWLAWAHLRGLKQVSNSLSTYYVGSFPDNMAAIRTSVIASAQKTLVISTDVAAYGRFSRFLEFAQYKRTIEDKLTAGVSVQTYCYDSEVGREGRRMQFPGDFERLRKSTEWENYVASHRNEVMPDTWEKFSNWLERNSREFEAELAARGASTQRLGQRLPVFFWIADDTVAAVSFVTYGASPREITFITRDKTLIEYLVITLAHATTAASALDSTSGSRRPAK